MSTNKQFCDLCLSVDADRKVDAVIFCVDCGDHLCESCHQYHLKSKFARNHKLSDTQDVPSPEVKDVLKRLTACTNHPENETAVYLCRDHEVLCCNECFFNDHRKCEIVESLASFATSENAAVDQNDKLSDIKAVLNQFESHAGALMEHENSLGDLVDKAETELKRALEKVKETLDNLYKEIERKAKVELDKEKSFVSGSIGTQKQAIETFMNQVIDLKQNIELVRQHGEHVHVYLLEREMITCQLDTLNQQLGTLHNSSTKQTLKISDIRKMNEHLKSVVDILTVTREEEGTRLEECPDWKKNDKVSMTEELEKQSDAVGHRPYHERVPVLLHSLSMHKLSNQDPWVESCLWTEKYIVASLRGCLEIKLVDTVSYNVIDSYKCNTAPWSISQHLNNTVLVCLPDETSVLLVDIKDGKLTNTRKISLKHKIYCVTSVTSEGVMLGLCRDNGSIEVYDMSLKYLETMRIEGGLSSKVAKAYKISVYEKQNKTSIFIQCYEKSVLLAIDGNGQCLFRYTLPSPDGLDVDNEGNIYVCSCNDNSIHQVNSRGDKVRELLNEELKYPADLCFNAAGDKFVIVDHSFGKEMKIYSFD